MAGYDLDDLGTRMKHYEMIGQSLSHVRGGDHIIVRLDGRAFSNFTKGMGRPYDISMSAAMQDTAEALVKEFNADIIYTQSDEISMVWNTKVGEQLMFGGRVSKWLSSTAAFASVIFNRVIEKHKPGYTGDKVPTFDARLFTVPNESEVVNALLWRQEDATKNAISMAAQSMFKHSELQGKKGHEMQEMMYDHHDINFNDFPAFFKRGIFVQRTTVEEPLSEEILAKIPEHLRKDAPKMVQRSKVLPFDCWILKVGMDQKISTEGVSIQSLRFDALFNRTAT